MLRDNKIKVAFVVPYPFGEAPGQRFRFEQYLTFLNQNNIQIEFFPFLSSETNRILYQKGYFFKKSFGIISSFVKRLFTLSKMASADLVFIHREASLIGPPIFEFILYRFYKKKIIFDFDDAIWLKNVSDANQFWSWLKNPKKTVNNLKYAHTIIAGNDYLADFARKFNFSVQTIPTTIDIGYHIPTRRIKKNYINIGWTGSDTTIQHFKLAIPVLKRIKNKYRNRINIILISNKSIDQNDLPIQFITWKKETEIADLSLLDIGIMPLPNDEWANGKCGFKGLQYMALKIPTVMSPVGVNCSIIEHTVNGYLAESEDEWLEYLSLLIENETVRTEIGNRGYKTVKEKYSVDANKDKYLQTIRSVALSQ